MPLKGLEPAPMIDNVKTQAAEQAEIGWAGLFGHGAASLTASGRHHYNLHTVAPRRWVARLRYQLLAGLLVSVVLPILLYLASRRLVLDEPASINTAIGGTCAFLMATYLFRRAITFPGVGILSHVLPATTAAYGLAVATFFGLRLDYSRVTFFASFVLAVLFFFAVSLYLRNQRGQRFYLVPSISTRVLAAIPGVDWVLLGQPTMPDDPAPVVVADLRAELGEEWERLIAEAAVAGHPVYHVKQIQESLSGRVEIEHLSENSFGSLIPNLSYRKLKRLVDVVSAVLLLPLLLIPGLIVAAAIRAETPGPVFFRQKRRGYRGEIFEVVKFRTMIHSDQPDEGDAKQKAITLLGDARITRVGRFLRRTRIDELPQIWNIILGEMSWIGPRPEALSLSEWYMAELPFYHYRHIVRPGITGWAQVHQGHVAALSEVHQKLQFDFYYVKNFSAWLDLLIVSKTIAIVFSGFGAK